MKKSDLREIGSIIEEKLEPIKKVLDEHTDKLDALTLDMITVQKKTDALPDLYSMIKDTREKVNEHNDRLDNLETPA